MKKLGWTVMALFTLLSLPASGDAQVPTPGAVPAFRYTVRAPRDFVVGRRRPDGQVELGAYGLRSPAAGEVAWFAAPRSMADVVVTLLDASEFAALRGDPQAWARAVVARHTDELVGHGPQGPPPVVEQPPGVEDRRHGLTASVARRYQSATGDMDLYVRFAERDGRLYRVALRISGPRTAARVRSWLRAFFDAPFNVTQSPLRAFAGGRPVRSLPPRNNE